MRGPPGSQSSTSKPEDLELCRKFEVSMSQMVKTPDSLSSTSKPEDLEWCQKHEDSQPGGVQQGSPESQSSQSGQHSSNSRSAVP